MTTAQLHAELLRNMSVIAEDETLLKRVARYLRRLAKEKEDASLLSKEEFFANIQKAEQQLERGEGKTFTSKNAMNAWLNAL